ADLMDYLRMRTYVLSAGKKDRHWKKRRKARLARLKRRQRLERLAPAVEPDILAKELRALGEEETLITSGIYRVFCVQAEKIPNTMAELGRLREETFRAVGEGTGQASDIDWWDQHYHHLILWNDEAKDIIGSYRMGLTDQLLAKFGRRGLYTTTLFEYSDKVLDKLTPAVELGRSFVQKKYQKSHVSLGLLWKGIAAFVYRNPLHSKLFGPVSISNEYHSMSKQILVEFIKDHHFDDNLAHEVNPTHPMKIKPVKLWNMDHDGKVLKKIDDVDELIAEIEPHMKNAPVLIRQYLRLNGKFLAFNVDPDFSDSLDALILCDLADATVVGKRYMGKAKHAEFLEKRKSMTAELATIKAAAKAGL
ncbi:MAG: GNAT family N-acetyltransferase, partial [Phycisphaerales bacterium]|nr:GNAT family N-acetyltransferase [Phycisphaerales bacterium]